MVSVERSHLCWVEEWVGMGIMQRWHQAERTTVLLNGWRFAYGRRLRHQALTFALFTVHLEETAASLAFGSVLITVVSFP